MTDAEIHRVALIRFNAPDGVASVGSGLLVNHRAVLTADHVADGSDHQVDFKECTHEIAEVIRSGSLDVDLAILILKKPIVGATPLRCARVDRDRVSLIGNCVAVGFPRFKRDLGKRKSAQVNGVIPTAEGLEQSGGQGLREGFLTLIGNREPAVPETEPGPVADAPSCPWGGMSGAVVTADGSVVGVVRSFNLAAGSQALTVTPLTAIEKLPEPERRRRFWDALSVPDPGKLARLPAIRAAGLEENNALKLLRAKQRGTTLKAAAEALAVGTVVGSVHSSHQNSVHPAAGTGHHRDSAASPGASGAHADPHERAEAASHLDPVPADVPHYDVHPADDSWHVDPYIHDLGTVY